MCKLGLGDEGSSAGLANAFDSSLLQGVPTIVVGLLLSDVGTAKDCR